MEASHLSELYNLISLKSYLEEENTWKPVLVVQHFQKLVTTFHKDHLNKQITISCSIDTALPMIRLSIKPSKPIKSTSKAIEATKQKQGRSSKNKASVLKKTEFELFYVSFQKISVGGTYRDFGVAQLVKGF